MRGGHYLRRLRTGARALAALVLFASCADNASAPPSTGSERDGGAGGDACGAGCGERDGEAPFVDGASPPDGSGGPPSDAGAGAGNTSDDGGDAGPAGPTQSVGGQLYGLTPGETITLQDNLGDDLTLSKNGTFAFATPVPGNRPYDVTILASPSSPIAQTCTVWDGTGGVGAGPVTNVRVNCDLLAYFPFTGSASDESGYGHDGVVTGASLTADRSGNAGAAYAFSDGGSIQAAMPVGFLPLSTEPRTLVAWLEPSQSNDALDAVFWGQGNCTALQFGLGDVGDKAAFWGGCDDYASALPVTVGAWTFVAIVYSPATPTSIFVYVNDTSATGTITPLMTGGSASFVIGGSAGSAFFTGAIDSVRVYGHALGAAEITSLRTAADP